MIKASKALDLMIYESIMKSSPNDVKDCPQYSTNLVDAWDMLSHLSQSRILDFSITKSSSGWWFHITDQEKIKVIDIKSECEECCGLKQTNDGTIAHQHGSTLPHAICLTVMQTLLGEDDDCR